MPVVEALRVILGVWRLANGRLERPNNRGLWRQAAGLNAPTTNACGQSAWWKLPRWILGVFDGFCGLKAGKRQAWTPSDHRAMEANGKLERSKTTNACGQCGCLSACWQTAARDFRGLKALQTAWLERPNNRGLWRKDGLAVNASNGFDKWQMAGLNALTTNDTRWQKQVWTL